MTNPELVRAKLRLLEGYLDELEQLQSIGADELKRSKRDLWAVEHGLQLAIESLLDIGNHIIADDKLGNPSNYREIIEILGSAGVLPGNFARELSGMPGFRNLLIHEYQKIDVNKVHEHLLSGPAQFKQFIGYINRYLG
jgi:uncharacterized protein YutE (UPF0331/DUF86 family)